MPFSSWRPEVGDGTIAQSDEASTRRFFQLAQPTLEPSSSSEDVTNLGDEERGLLPPTAGGPAPSELVHVLVCARGKEVSRAPDGSHDGVREASTRTERQILNQISAWGARGKDRILALESKVTPIVIDDSETEDDSDDENLASMRTSTKPGASTSRTAVLNSTRNVHATVVDDSETEDHSDDNEPKNAPPNKSSAGKLADSVSASSASWYHTFCHPENPARIYDGAFFPTATLHANPRVDGREAISFQDIIGPASSSDLNLALLSSFGSFPPAVPVVLVVGSGTEKSGQSMCNAFDNWVQTYPKLGTGGCMHMKAPYMILFYKSGRLRVFISTANLIPINWEHLENAVFIQDIALNSSSSVIGDSLADQTKKSTSGAKTEAGFATILESVLKATNVGPALEHLKQMKFDPPLNSIDQLSKLWNWSNATAELGPMMPLT
ncbi:hypothetical protein DFH09DRAFT_1278058 [Mycena vulgaris]|nr:hypothetical protein DFH09DRAFT_1278058 [Mycena vulgaris]